MEFDIEMEGLDEMAEALGTTLDGVLPAAAVGAGKAAQTIRSTAQDLVPVDSGEARERISATKGEIEGDTATAKVISGAEHSIYIEMGTGPKGAEHHEGIDPNADPAYRTNGWVYPLADGKGFRYTEGQPARPFMYPAMKQNEQKTEATIAEEVRKAVET